MSKTTYKFSNVRIKGKPYAFTVKDVSSFKHALQKATNFVVKTGGYNQDDWTDQYSTLKQNIENGYTDISVEKSPEQGELDLSYNSTFQELYSGLINEVESSKK